MWAVEAGFLPALASSHALISVAKTYLGGVETGTLALEPGSSVAVSGRRQVRRTARLVLSERQWTDLIAPNGAEVKVWSTIGNGFGTFALVPVFTGRVERRARLRKSGLITVQGWDRFAAINDDAFDTLRPALEGATIVSEIIQMIRETHPTASVLDTTGSQFTIPPALTWDAGDRSRGAAIDKMALAIGAEVVALPDGNFVIRPVPTLTDTPVWTVSTGPGGVVVSDAQEESRTGVANRWIINGSQTAANTATVRAIATIPDGPLRFDGPYGRVTRTYFDPMISTGVQGSVVGQAILARVQGIARQRTVQVVTNPALEAGDVLAVNTDDGYELHLADEFEIPLSPEQPTMSIASRSDVQ